MIAAIIVLALLLGIAGLIIKNSSNQSVFSRDGIVITEIQETGDVIDGMFSLTSNGTTLAYDTQDMLLSLSTKSGTRITSYPQTTPQDGLTALGKLALKSPFEFTYITDDSVIKTVNPITTDGITVKAVNIKDGLALVVRYNEIRIGFTIEITVIDGDLYVTIPFNGLRDSDHARLISIVAFPLLGAARQGDDGYAVLPDGAGGIVYFKNEHRIYEGKGYEKEIYSEDLTIASYHKEYEEKIRLPLYGMVTKEGALTVIGTKGESDDKIILSPPGSMGIGFYRTYFEHVYRKSYIAQIAKGQFVTQYQSGIIPGDKQTIYRFAAKPDASFVDCADSYSDYRIQNGLAANPGIHDDQWIKYFMAIKKGNSGISDKMEVLTSIGQLAAISEIILSYGKCNFEISGHFKDGYFSSATDKYPINSKIGSEKELMDTIKTLKDNGARVTLEENYTDDFRDGTSIGKKVAAVKTPEDRIFIFTKILPNGVKKPIAGQSFLNPVFALGNIVSDLNYIDRFKPDSLKVRYIGQTAFTDYNSTHHLLKQQTILAYSQQLRKIKEKGLEADVDSGNAYVFGNVKRITDVSMETSGLFILDEAVPLYSIIAGRFAILYSKPLNITDDVDQSILKCIEFGLLPKFEITEKSAAIFSDTNYSFLYSSDFGTHKASIEKAADIVEKIGNVQLIAHRKIAPEVYESTYAGDVKVIFNYSDAAYTLENGIAVEAGSYLVQ